MGVGFDLIFLIHVSKLSYMFVQVRLIVNKKNDTFN